jgi:predicted transcriptional regulator of viral defense system
MTTLSHTPTGRTSRAAVLSEAKRNGVVLAREVLRRGIHTQTLTRLVAEGRLERVSRGVYAWPDADVTEHHSLVLASAAVPNGVVCLVSALVFHGIGTQLPQEIWLALDRRARKPSAWAVPMRVVRFSGTAITFGVEEHQLEAKTVRVYSLAKTVADCFKYRNKVGIDVAVEALRESLADGRLTPAEIEPAARACRVERVIRPYLEALTP